MKTLQQVNLFIRIHRGKQILSGMKPRTESTLGQKLERSVLINSNLIKQGFREKLKIFILELSFKPIGELYTVKHIQIPPLFKNVLEEGTTLEAEEKNLQLQRIFAKEENIKSLLDYIAGMIRGCSTDDMKSVFNFIVDSDMHNKNYKLLIKLEGEVIMRLNFSEVRDDKKDFGPKDVKLIYPAWLGRF